VHRFLLCLSLFSAVVAPADAAQATAQEAGGTPSQASSAAPPGLITASGLCERGRQLDAIDLFDRILADRIGTVAVAETDAALDGCMSLLERADDSEALLAAILRREGTPSGLKALGTLARREIAAQEGCSAGGPLYRQLVDLHGATREAARVIIARATRCLEMPGDETEALRDLEHVAGLHAGMPEGAMALYELANHYRDREERDRAAVYYQKLIDAYPESLEYPRHPGLRIVHSARIELGLLHVYYFSPGLDRLRSWIQHEVLIRRLHLDAFDAGGLSIVLVPWLVTVASLGLLLVLAPLLSRRSPQSLGSAGTLLDRRWTVWQAVLVLAVWYTLDLFLQTSASPIGPIDMGPIGRFLAFDGGSQLVAAVAVFILVLRREPLGRVFAIDQRRLVRLALWSAGGIVGTVVVASLVLLALRGIGVVSPGSNQDRFLSEGAIWPSQWWSLGVVLVVLSAVTEEVLFRGVLHDALRRVVPIPLAAVLGSFAFATSHVRPLQHTVIVFVIGLVLVLLRERFQSLAPGSIVHSLWNLLMFWIR
jgi:membrane protease YdiL (CAAX protease family)